MDTGDLCDIFGSFIILMIIISFFNVLFLLLSIITHQIIPHRFLNHFIRNAALGLNWLIGREGKVACVVCACVWWELLKFYFTFPFTHT